MRQEVPFKMQSWNAEVSYHHGTVIRALGEEDDRMVPSLAGK
jgi:hypothetical protein